MDGNTLSELNKQIHSPDHLPDRQQEKKHNTGIALPNIHKRIQLLFGEEYGINVYSTLNQGTDVEITIPADYERNSTKS
jgi:two-component system sensor histidine kinase YesM